MAYDTIMKNKFGSQIYLVRRNSSERIGAFTYGPITEGIHYQKNEEGLLELIKPISNELFRFDPKFDAWEWSPLGSV